jgi:hypothetical protein
MADDDLVREYKRQLAEKDDIIAGLRKESGDRRVKNKELVKSLADVTKERDEFRVTADDLKSKATATPGESLERIASLEGELRDIKHKGAFKEAAITGGVRPDAVDALWTLSGYKAETPEADPNAIAELVKGSREKFSYLYQAEGQPAAGAGQQSQQSQQAKAALGADRGRTPAGHTLRVSNAQLSDPKWCFDNQAAFAEATKAGTVIFAD